MNIWCLIFLFMAIAGFGHAEEEDDHIAPVPLPQPPLNRVLEARPTRIEKYPFVVQIIHMKTVDNLNKLVCGGALLSRRYVLSAAHCFVTASSCYQGNLAFDITANTTTADSNTTTADSNSTTADPITTERTKKTKPPKEKNKYNKNIHNLRIEERELLMQRPPLYRPIMERSGQYVDPMKYRVRVGETGVTSSGQRGHEVSTIIIHEKYSCVDHDIALVRMWKLVLLADGVAIVDLPNQGDSLVEDAVLTSIGWRYQGQSGKGNTDVHNNILHEVSVQKVKWTECKDIFLKMDPPRPITASVICVKPSGDGGGPCSFENGGPLVYNNVLVGLAARQDSAGCDEYPDVYTRVSSHTTWILNMIKMSTHRALPFPLSNASPINKIEVTMLTSFLFLVLNA